MNIIEKIVLALNIFGITFQLIGVYKLFNQITGLKKIDEPSALRIPPNDIHGMLNHLKEQLNEVIISTNKTNKKIFESSKKWLILIITGYVLQLFAVLLGASVSHSPSKNISNSNTTQNSNNKYSNHNSKLQKQII